MWSKAVVDLGIWLQRRRQLHIDLVLLLLLRLKLKQVLVLGLPQQLLLPCICTR